LAPRGASTIANTIDHAARVVVLHGADFHTSEQRILDRFPDSRVDFMRLGNPDHPAYLERIRFHQARVLVEGYPPDAPAVLFPGPAAPDGTDDATDPAQHTPTPALPAENRVGSPLSLEVLPALSPRVLPTVPSPLSSHTVHASSDSKSNSDSDSDSSAESESRADSAAVLRRHRVNLVQQSAPQYTTPTHLVDIVSPPTP
jgi:hypothetical protein